LIYFFFYAPFFWYISSLYLLVLITLLNASVDIFYNSLQWFEHWKCFLLKKKIEKAFWFHHQFFCMSSSFKVLGLKHNHALHHALSFPGYFQKDLISLTWKKKGLYKALHFWNVFSSCSTWFNHIAHIYMSNQKSKYFIGFYMIRSLRSQLYESLVISCLIK
jgi:hypothetical protein